MKAAWLVILVLALCVPGLVAQTPNGSASPETSPSPEKVAQKSGSNTPPPSIAAVKVGKAAALALPPEKANPIKLVLFNKPPVIDGKLDDEVWKTATLLKDFYQVQPGDNIIPPNKTEVMLGYDSHFIYVAFHCFDEPD